VFFARHAPEEASQVTQAAMEAGNTFLARLRSGLDVSPLMNRLRNSVQSSGMIVQDFRDPVQVFFVPEQEPGKSAAEAALLGLINGAQKNIVCAFYDFELEEIAQALIARHAAGVNVALVSDSDYSGRPGLILCREGGIPVIFDKRSALMHNKFCVVDGRYVWTGSTNITRNCMYENNNNSVLIVSTELAANFAAEFEEMFLQHQFGPRSPKNTRWPTVTVGDTEVECYFAPEDGVQDRILARLEQARKEVAFLAFVFTSEPIAKTMASSLEAGVQVRGVIEKRSAGSRHSRHAYLIERGADIYIDGNPNTMHHKVIVVDGQLVMTGSYNFSAGAEEKNDENLIIIHNTDIAVKFLEEIGRVIADATKSN
jgi:phosphatidylserine/phosphatidylglycerophosphate/cardiolipin synthase-like enzyme